LGLNETPQTSLPMARG